MVKVESIVSEFLSAQSLKVLPQGPFGDAVNQFVSKDDKHAMELFVSEHLTGQVQQMLGLESDDEDLNSAMEIYRSRIEEQVASGAAKRGVLAQERKRVLRPKPDTWDSDFDGRWEDEPDAWEYEDVAQSMAPTTQSASRQARGQNRSRNADEDEDEDLMEAAEPPKKTAGRGSRATMSRTTKAAPKKAAAPAKKPPARGRGRKAVEPSDDEEEEEDVVMDSNEEEDEPAPPPPKARATRQPARKSAAPAARKAATSRGTRQTTLNFSQSQSQRPGARGGGSGTQQKPMEVSDDEISDEDDAFEPAPVASRTRRR